MPLNEPRIFTPRPKWLVLEELSRSDAGVWFKTRSGRIMVPLKYVEKYEQEQENAKKR